MWQIAILLTFLITHSVTVDKSPLWHVRVWVENFIPCFFYLFTHSVSFSQKNVNWFMIDGIRGNICVEWTRFKNRFKQFLDCSEYFVEFWRRERNVLKMKSRKKSPNLQFHFWFDATLRLVYAVRFDATLRWVYAVRFVETLRWVYAVRFDL